MTREASSNNPKLSPWVRLYVVALLLVLAGGIALLFGNTYVTTRWPWPLAPYAGRLLGAIYASEFVAAGILLLFNRVAPGRMILAMAFPFALLGAVVPFFYPDLFDFTRRKPIAWLVLYGGSALLVAFFLWQARKLAAPAGKLPVGWRVFFLIEGIAVGLFAAALLVAPLAATRAWPWPVNPFDAQFYSAVVLSVAVGSLMLSRRAAVADLFAFGVIEVAFGCLLLAALALTPTATAASEWEHAAGTPWSFATGCGAIIFLGAASLVAASRVRIV